MHCAMSMSSATQASAQLVQNSEHSMACRAAVTSSSVSFSTCGWAAIMVEATLANSLVGRGYAQAMDRKPQWFRLVFGQAFAAARWIESIISAGGQGLDSACARGNRSATSSGDSRPEWKMTGTFSAIICSASG